jgi:dienelactone hydrolase
MKTLWDAVSFVSRQPQVDPQRIGLLGFSVGGYLALSASAIDSRIRAVVEFFGGMPKEMKLLDKLEAVPLGSAHNSHLFPHSL